MFLKISFLAWLIISFICFASSKLTHYESFMKLIKEDSNVYHDGCLLSFEEFTFTKYGYFKIPDFCPEKKTYAKFIISFTADVTIVRDLNTFRKLANDFGKFTLACYIQFHHFNSYHYEHNWALLTDPYSEFNYKKLSSLKVLDDSVNFYERGSKFFKPWLLQLSPVSVILYFSYPILDNIYTSFANQIIDFLSMPSWSNSKL